MGSNKEKNPIANVQNKYKHEVKSDIVRYIKVGRATTIWEAIQKSQILMSKYWKSSVKNSYCILGAPKSFLPREANTSNHKKY